MKLHDLRPADGSRTARTRVGRGIAAGKGKTAGRGTKGQKARAGGSIPAGFEGGQTPIHRRIPRLRGFKNRFKVEFEVVNVGAIAQLVEAGAFAAGEIPGSKREASAKSSRAPITINQDILRAVGLVRTLAKPLKVLGSGELAAPLFVVADAFSKTAVTKIEAAGGSISILETPSGVAPLIRVATRPGAPTRAGGAAPETAPSTPSPTPTSEPEPKPASEPESAAAKAPRGKASKPGAATATGAAATATGAAATATATPAEQTPKSEPARKPATSKRSGRVSADTTAEESSAATTESPDVPPASEDAGSDG
ncbi:MAG TPA: 50S ribosomal protein L15 [Candidatus Limnocylindrales bacterium]